ncbi:MAG: CAP domain-containing protein [Candidatus Paceibacterales bacterium]
MKKFSKLFIIFIIFLGVFLFFWNDLLDIYSELSLRLPQIEKGVTEFLIKETEKQISIPPPLRAEREAPEAFLTHTGIIQWTNIQREKYGLPSFMENKTLNAMAEKKVQDMFEKQYFAHYSPLGVGMEDLAKSARYEFIAIGENLAFGNFQDDEVLVQAWMDSPGHRENILNDDYQEIGVAVSKDIFDGESTWLAVQHFGLPLSACPQLDETLETKIGTNQNQIKELQKTLEALLVKIQTMKPKRGRAYNQKIEQYNALASQYNTLIEETEVLVNKYNNQVRLFNECAAGAK